jgi:hypothetical protein
MLSVEIRASKQVHLDSSGKNVKNKVSSENIQVETSFLTVIPRRAEGNHISL